MDFQKINLERVLTGFRFGVRHRLILVLLSGLLISLTLSSWLILREQSRQIDVEITRHGTQLARILARSLANSVVGYDYHGIQLFLDDTVRIPQVSYLKVFSVKGNAMAVAQQLDINPASLRTFEEPIDINGKVIGKLLVGINIDPIVTQIETQKSQLITREITVVVFILVLVYIALSFLIVRPLRIIATTLLHNASNQGVLPEAIPLERHDEFGDIARKFNLMRDHLNEANRALQGKVEVADSKLREVNSHLMNKSHELEKMNVILQTQAVTDPLTGLYNRREFQVLMSNQIPALISQGEHIGFLLIDIDYFKRINDQHGHDVGDYVLREVAERMGKITRKSDIICRIGGEEFFVLCRSVGAVDAHNIGEKIREVVQEKPLIANGMHIYVTVSIGIATNHQANNVVPIKSQNANVMYRQADMALYHSKTTGRNRVTCFAQLPHDEMRKLSV
ncbi:MAG: diguanylate cyclase [Gammaproteobacteria bacterium]|nr:diguanylate cyclase [Gammaproteobacteria bacterium]